MRRLLSDWVCSILVVPVCLDARELLSTVVARWVKSNTASVAKLCSTFMTRCVFFVKNDIP